MARRSHRRSGACLATGRAAVTRPTTGHPRAGGWRGSRVIDDHDRELHQASHEECGVFGIYGPGEDVARITFFGLYALQHRGQESAGIVTADGESLIAHTRMGLVAQVFTEEDLQGLRGHIAVGHTRYSTTGSSKIHNAQPLVVRGPDGELALAHNGNLVNAGPLHDELAEHGCHFRTSTDSEVIARMFAEGPGDD